MDFEDIWSKTKLVLTPSFGRVDERWSRVPISGPGGLRVALSGCFGVAEASSTLATSTGSVYPPASLTYVLLNLMHQGRRRLRHVVSFLGYCFCPLYY